MPREVWIQFADMEAFTSGEQELYQMLRTSEGKDLVIIYIRSPKCMKKLGKSWAVCADEALLKKIAGRFGKDNVKVVEKYIENIGKMN